jgi:lantibiotic modifying enzyme
LGGFNNHLADSRKPEAFAATQCSDLDEFINNLDELLLPDLARQIERISIFNATSTRATPSLLGPDSN